MKISELSRAELSHRFRCGASRLRVRSLASSKRPSEGISQDTPEDIPGDIPGDIQGEGVAFWMGPFVVRMRSSVEHLVEEFQSLYGDYTLADEVPIADYHVQLSRPAGLRRWVRPQVEFLIDGQRAFHPFPLQSALALMEWGLNYCVFTLAHQYLIFHSAVLERGGRAMLLAAPPGSGKSTLCAAMIHRGWRLFSDEIGLLRRQDGQLTPIPRPVNLKKGSISVIREFAPQAQFGPIMPDTRKGTVIHIRPPVDSVIRSRETAQPAWVIFPCYRAGSTTRLEPLTRCRALLRLAHSAFNYNLLGIRGFEMLADLIDTCQCYEFTYSNLDEAMATFADMAQS